MRITAIHYTEENGETLVWLGGEGVVITIKTKSKQEADRIAEAVEILINGKKENKKMEKEEIKELVGSVVSEIWKDRFKDTPQAIEVPPEHDKQQAISFCCRLLQDNYYQPGPLCKNIQAKINAVVTSELKELL